MKNNLTLVDKLNHIKNLFIIGKSDGNLNEKEIEEIYMSFWGNDLEESYKIYEQNDQE